MASVRGCSTVIVNGMEGEPLSEKDGWLLTHAPHLVADGAIAAAELLGAREIVLAVARDGLAGVLGPRGVRVVRGPDRYLSGQESALAGWVRGGRPVPAARRPADRGIFVSNAETFAHLGLIARHGADWFRSAGTAAAPGTLLLTISGAVARPGVVEVPVGSPLAPLIAGSSGAVLTGGYGGAWIGAQGARSLWLEPEAMRERGAVLGPGIVSVLPATVSGLSDTRRIVRWMAAQGAGQCGPCRFGLPAVAADLDALDLDPGALPRLRARAELLRGRGGCAHPDGVERLVSSALDVFAHELRAAA
ncbi:NADH-ubiquinone oxidoreductase-F iron-sulfur binding region domain-containing protein [Actinocorallia longicatena]|uniref:NADH-ubiquinone oxidoreductase-F iron-sulfur binding region domain-containing protein n=2 Tax=Actinocorallia longicatena TaxID=111803 RepID=A0ABP6QAH9_9ACTN